MATEKESTHAHAAPMKGELLSPLGAHVLRREFHHVRKHWWWFLVLGGLLVLCGVVAIVLPILATAAAIAVLAAVFLIAGVATIFGAVFSGKWSGVFIHILAGILYIVVGMMITEEPVRMAKAVTFLVAVMFLVSGAFRLSASLLYRFPQWGWSVLNGAVTLLCGLIIVRHLPENTFWVLGLLVGLEMLFAGWTWIMLSLAVRDIPEEFVA